MKRKTQFNRFVTGTIAFVSLVSSDRANASTGGGGLPWESVLQRIADSFAGPVTQAILVLAIIGLGFAVMWSEGPVLRRAFGVLLGGAIAAAAASIALSLFGITSGATF